MLCDPLALGEKESGHKVERIVLADMKIESCSACGHCQTNTGVCPKKDYVAGILDKIVAADDRTAARYQEMNDKEFY